MNCADDALWWALKDKYVRDLAMLLCGPPLWHNEHELSVPTLLGDRGFRYLLALDQEPDVLHAYLGVFKTPFLLGHYAEDLLAFWFEHAPHTQLLARNLIIYDKQETHNKTLAEVDFWVEINQRIHQIELTTKYYIAYGQTEDSVKGIHPKDVFLDKVTKIEKQLAFNIPPTEIKARKLPSLPIKSSIIRGMLFLDGPDFHFNRLNPYANFGGIGYHPVAFGLTEILFNQCRFLSLNKTDYLAPLMSLTSIGQAAKDFTPIPGQCVVALHQRPDGAWHEKGRSFIL